MQNLDSRPLLLQHVFQPAIGLRRLVQTSTAEYYALAFQPTIHHLRGDPAGLAPDAPAPVPLASGLRAAHDPAGAMYRREERLTLLLGNLSSALQDHGVVTHGAAHEALLTRECRRGPLAHEDRKSTRLNSSHVAISYAVFC